MFESPLWQAFLTGQSIAFVATVEDLRSSGILHQLMTKNTSAVLNFECTSYWDGTYEDLDSPQHVDSFVVKASPAQSAFRIFRNGAKIAYRGPRVEDGTLVPTAKLDPGLSWPHILLDFDKIPEVWGAPHRAAARNSYPRCFEIADERYIRVVSYADSDFRAGGVWHETVIDSKFSIAVLVARHVGQEIDGIWTLTSVEEFGEDKGASTRSMKYEWDLSSLG